MNQLVLAGDDPIEHSQDIDVEGGRFVGPELLNGGGRATDNAPERLRSAEEKARLAGRGVWER